MRRNSTTRARILEYVNKEPDKSYRQIARACGVKSPATVGEHLRHIRSHNKCKACDGTGYTRKAGRPTKNGTAARSAVFRR